jgi:hypothetical protein
MGQDMRAKHATDHGYPYQKRFRGYIPFNQ